MLSPEQQAAIGKYASLHVHTNQTFSPVRGIANGRVLIGRPLNVHVRAVAHAKFKTTIKAFWSTNKLTMNAIPCLSAILSP